jgi:segregation and condensation protein B
MTLTNEHVPATEDSAHSLPARIESLLFVADRPTPTDVIAQVLETSVEAVEEALRTLDQQLATRGIRLQRKGSLVQLVSMPEAAPYIQRFLGLELSGRLTQPALETLAIIAYRQPITRAALEAIRGVNCDGVLRTLVSRGLVEEVGRLEQAGRPILYGTTFEFLQYFGLKSLDDLPPLDLSEGNSNHTPSMANLPEPH